MKTDELTEEFLKGKLLDKHKSFLVEEKRRLKDMKRLAILEDKIDQLAHWIENEEKDAGKLLSQKEKTERELVDLESRLGPYSHKKIMDVEEKIREHEESLAFWKGK